MKKSTLKKGIFFLFFILLSIMEIKENQKAVANSYACVVRRMEAKTPKPQNTQLIKKGDTQSVVLLQQDEEISQPSSDPFADVEGTDTEWGWGEYVY